MTFCRFASLVVLFSSTAATLNAQGGGAPSEGSPLHCLAIARDYEAAQYHAAQTQNIKFDSDAWHAQAIAKASACATKFDPATIAANERPALGFLYMAIGDTTKGASTLARAERELPADPETRATALLQLMQAYGANPNPKAALDDLMRLMQRLDTVPGAHAQKLTAHGTLVSLANNADLDDVARSNFNAIIALVPQLSPSEQARFSKIILNAYETRAVHQANALHADSAMQTLQAAPAALPGIPDAAATLAKEIARYSMVGKPAPALHADYWVNKQALPLTGHATVLVFTANWCHSCRTSYSAIEAAMKAYAPSRLQTVFSINLDGSFEGIPMSPAQEVEANRKYYAVEHGFTNPIAIQRNASGEMPKPLATLNSDAYVLAYLPQVVIIDQRGIVRAFLQGWDAAGNRERSFRSALTMVLGSNVATR